MGASSLEAHGKAHSRRSLLAVGAGLLALTPRPLFAEESKEQLPAKAAGPRLSIAVHIGGKGPFQFIVDTGAERSVVAAEVASALELPVRERVTVRGIARAVPADTVEIDGLDVGHIHVRRAVLPVLPREWMGADGYLGLDVLDNHRVDFDFRNGTLTLGPPAPHIIPSFQRPDEAVVRTGGAHGKLRAVDCFVGQTTVQAFIDSGAEASVGNTALLAGLAAHGRPTPAAQETVRLTGVTGGFVDCPRLRMGRMTMPGMELEGFELAIADLDIFQVWGLAHRPAMFIGMDMLRGFNRVAIDYSRSEYHFDVGATGPWLIRRA